MWTTCVWDIENMVLQFYFDDCIMFSPYKYKIDNLYASIQAYLKIEDNG